MDQERAPTKTTPGQSTDRGSIFSFGWSRYTRQFLSLLGAILLNVSRNGLKIKWAYDMETLIKYKYI